jgi:hypothetical protein
VKKIKRASVSLKKRIRGGKSNISVPLSSEQNEQEEKTRRAFEESLFGEDKQVSVSPHKRTSLDFGDF